MFPPPIKPMWIVICLERSYLIQEAFHAGPALPSGFFGRRATTPVRFQADGEAVPVKLKGRKLALPIDHPASHRRPFVAMIRLFQSILAMAVPKPVFWQKTVSCGIRDLASL